MRSLHKPPKVTGKSLNMLGKKACAKIENKPLQKPFSLGFRNTSNQLHKPASLPVPVEAERAIEVALDWFCCTRPGEGPYNPILRNRLTAFPRSR
jgi:hypothetical protein